MRSVSKISYVIYFTSIYALNIYASVTNRQEICRTLNVQRVEKLQRRVIRRLVASWIFVEVSTLKFLDHMVGEKIRYRTRKMKKEKGKFWINFVAANDAAGSRGKERVLRKRGLEKWKKKEKERTEQLWTEWTFLVWLLRILNENVLSFLARNLIKLSSEGNCAKLYTLVLVNLLFSEALV